MGGNVIQDYSPNDAKQEHVRPDRPPRDEEIKAFRIYLVDPETGKLSEPVPLLDVLDARLKDEKGRPTQCLQEVAPASPKEDRPYPVCKMFDKKSVRAVETAKQKAKRETKQQTKQLEISWTVSDNDLSHRLVRLKEFLEKGWKVELVFGARRKGWMGKRKATPEEIERVLERIKSAVGEIEGAKEWKPMQGLVGEQAVLSYRGNSDKGA
ncbi:hypothetical protein N7G274_000124 [Stereocaulon virgatum]|uniref:Translation initiation factor IF-3 n=1 Tax=Stereocaulon virgatum TaxID=373712 RepID=A0ABR4ASX3_9LECA